MPESDHNFCIPLEEIYKRYSKKELITKLMDKTKLIDSAEKTITDQEIEIKELRQDIKQNKTVQILHAKVKELKKKIEVILKNHDLQHEEWQLDYLRQGVELEKIKKKNEI